MIETALAVIADAFNAEGVIMTSRDRGTDGADGGQAHTATGDEPGALSTPGLALRLPPSWGPSSPALFAVYGNLWEMLTAARHHCARCGSSDRPLAYTQQRVDSHWAWFCRIDDQAVSVAAALIRATPFDEAESDALARAMGSVVSAVSPSTVDGVELGSLKTKVATDISLSANTSEGDPANAITAEVSVQDPTNAGLVGSGKVASGLAPLTATGHGPDIETAVARAAANACQPQCRILFAGSSDLGGNTISIVIIDDESGAPRLGVSVRPVGDYAGVAEAVFLAASTGGIPSLR